MAELVGKRWFQVISVIILLVVFLVGMAVVKSRKDTKVPPAAGVVADVCGAPITRLEYQSVISRSTIKQYNRDRMVRAADRERLHILAFKDLVNDKLLTKEGDRLGLKVSEIEINQRIDSIKKNLDPRRRDLMYSVFLQTGGYRTEQELREDLRYEILENKITQKLFPPTKYKISQKEVRDNIPSIKLSQIYLPLTPDLPPSSGGINDAYTKNEELAADIYKKAMAGADFSELAVKYSQDTSAEKAKGSLGWVAAAQVVPRFWQAVKSLEPGEISFPFKTDLGIHIVKCEARNDPGTIQYSDAYAVLRNAIIFRKQKNDFAAWFARKLAKMQEEDCIKVYDSELLANKYRAMGKYDKAIEEYKKAIKEDREYAYYYVDIAELLGKQGKKTEALKWLRKSTEISPMDGGLYCSIGEVYMGYGEPEKALREFQRCSDLSRLDLEVHMRLQQIYSQFGLMQEAEEEHKRYLKAIEMRGGRKSTEPPAEKGGEEPSGMPDMIGPEGGQESTPQHGLPLREPGQR